MDKGHELDREHGLARRTGGKRRGRTGWVAQDLGGRLAGVVLTRGIVQVCWGQAPQKHFGRGAGRAPLGRTQGSTGLGSDPEQSGF